MALNLYLFSTFQLNRVLCLETSAVSILKLRRFVTTLRSRLSKNIYLFYDFFSHFRSLSVKKMKCLNKCLFGSVQIISPVDS